MVVALALVGVVVCALFDRWHERRCVERIRKKHRDTIGPEDH